jgi:predicted TIM-barrel fold metal-dependent hydrolase
MQTMRSRSDAGLSRRDLLGGLAALGMGAFVGGTRSLAQTTAKARLINVHLHLIAPTYLKFLNEEAEPGGNQPFKSAAQTMEDMDKAGIDVGLASIAPPGIWTGDVDRTRRLARECNDFAAKLVSDYPGRLGSFIALPLPDIDGSLREIEYGFDTLKADGVYMFTNWGGKFLFGDKYLGDAALAPVYEELQRRKAVVFTHPRDSVCCRGIVGGVPGATIEYPMDSTRTIMSLLATGTAAKYPDVKFIFSHAGGATTSLVGRIAGAGVVNLQDGGVMKAGAPAASERLKQLQRFYYDTAGMANPIAMGALRKMVPLSQIVFGNDYPFGQADQQHKLLVDCGVFSAEELRAIDSGNISALLPKFRG